MGDGGQIETVRDKLGDEVGDTAGSWDLGSLSPTGFLTVLPLVSQLVSHLVAQLCFPFTCLHIIIHIHIYISTHIYIYIYIHVISHVIRCMNYLARSILDSLNNIWSTKKIEVAWNTSASQYQRWAPNSQLLCCCIDQFELVCNFNLQPVICWSGLGGCTAL